MSWLSQKHEFRGPKLGQRRGNQSVRTLVVRLLSGFDLRDGSPRNQKESKGNSGPTWMLSRWGLEPLLEPGTKTRSEDDVPTASRPSRRCSSVRQQI